jgi:hypothetical protein
LQAFSRFRPVERHRPPQPTERPGVKRLILVPGLDADGVNTMLLLRKIRVLTSTARVFGAEY